MSAFFFLFPFFATALSVDLQPYSHSAMLDGQGKYMLHWRHHGTSVTFLLQVETLGYVGFGFSPNGDMASSDIVIGGVEGGKPYLQDFYSDSNRILHRDPHQNYLLEYAMENGTYTILKFSRDLHTCDPNDKTITESTIRVIWAFHNEDFGQTGPTYHGLNKGRKSLRLLNPEKTYIKPVDAPSFNFTNRNVSLNVFICFLLYKTVSMAFCCFSCRNGPIITSGKSLWRLNIKIITHISCKISIF
ncbi:DBH-like monooxygenase protein 1 isoform X1 [Xenopus laevis]|uniref:DBH-like monooxygenase protein 1 isoform X1 n=1 Tax=Xenopus laevis TaxID=8355 RepID=A0A8J1KTA0_XENLA|nr:DBH-like monooxygenase protein 1 isoform X1 [Xenopus laevis]